MDNDDKEMEQNLEQKQPEIPDNGKPVVTETEEHVANTATQVQPSKKTNSKKLVLVVVALIALISLGAYFLMASDGGNDDEATNDNSSDVTVDPVSMTYLLGLDGNQNFRIAEDMSTEDLDTVTLPDENTLFRVYTENRVAYLTFLDGQDIETGEDLTYGIAVQNLNGDTSPSIVINNTEIDFDEYQVIHPIAWLNEDVLLMQRRACLECDAPGQAVFYELNINTANIELVADLESEYDTAGQRSSTTVSYDGTKLAFATEPPGFAPAYEQIEGYESFVIVYDFTTAESEKVFTTNNDEYVKVLGFNEDKSGVIVSVITYSEGDVEAEYEFDSIATINIDNGQIAKKSIQLSELQSMSGGVREATTFGDQMVFVTRQSGETYRLHSFDTTISEFTIEQLRTSNEPILLQGFVTELSEN